MPAIKNRSYPLSLALLEKYKEAALENADELLAEARLLLHHKSHARAYFLGVASIEEIGKAVISHDALGRNISDSAVATRLRINFEDHSQKVTSAFIPWLLATPDLREQVMSYVNTMIDVKNGREPSMYVDVLQDGSDVVRPKTIVSLDAATNCVSLVVAVRLHARHYITNSPAKVRNKAEDELFAMKQTTFLKMTNTADFWEYYMARMRAGDMAFEIAATTYHEVYFAKSKPFLTPSPAPDDA